MKNLYILPTNKPSRLVKIYNDVNRETFTLKLDVEVNDSFKEYVNIYITSNEEIKEGFVLHLYTNRILEVGVISESNGNKSFREKNYHINGIEVLICDCKKIILTIDQDLIEKGLQEIPDEFLEWFVKNPSCEFAHLGFTSIIGDSETKRTYKIIIPKENPKQIKCYDKFNQILKEGDYVDVQKNGIHKIYKKEDGQLYFKPYGEEDKVSNYFSNDMVKCDKDGNWITNDLYEDMDESTQEALEEAAKKFYPPKTTDLICSPKLVRDSFIAGAKWQQEQDKNLYSEEDLREAFRQGELNINYSEMYGLDSELTEQQWFEQFKKK